MDITKDIISKLINLVREETKPAVGCTEPVAVAFAAANARKYLEGEINSIDVNVSLNIFKNGKSVYIPNTNEWGLELAAALGAICGNPDNGLCIFNNVNDEYLNVAKKMLENKIVKVYPIDNGESIFIEVKIKSDCNCVKVIVNKAHTHVQQIEVNGKVIFEDNIKEESIKEDHILKQLSFKDLRQVVEEADKEEILFLLEGIEMNKRAAEEGLKGNKGINVGAELIRMQNKGILCNDIFTKARILTVSAAGYRMRGGKCPIMTSGGSGNQGIGVTLPIYVVAKKENLSDEIISRALLYAHLVNLYIKEYTGKLSSMCGCAIAAGAGVSAAVAWLLGGDDTQIEGAVKNLLSNLTGMLCDGAKESCALKLSVSAEEALIAAYLSVSNKIVSSGTGIIGNTIESTISNLEILCREGLKNMEMVLVDVMNS